MASRMKRGWFYDIVSNMKVCYREHDPISSNNGDYHHHEWQGPYKTFDSAKRAGLEQLKSELNMAQRRFTDFRGLKKNGN